MSFERRVPPPPAAGAPSDPGGGNRAAPGSPARRRFDRLALRLSAAISLFVLILLSAGLFALSKLHFDRTIQARRQAGELQSRVLGAALRHQMIERDRTLIETIIREIGREPEVHDAMIIDHQGVVKFSSRPARVGTRLSPDSPSCMPCHSRKAEDRARWVRLDVDEVEVIRSVLPLENRPPCHECHDPAQRLNGVLILDVSLQSVLARLGNDSLWMGVATVILALLLLAGVGLLVKKLVLKRLTQLSRTARSITAGHFEERAEVRGDDSIASLALDFNNMAEATSRLLADVREREAQLSSVMNSLEDGLVVLDRDCRVVGANRSFSRRVGRYPEDICGLGCRDAAHGALPCQSGEGDCPASLCRESGHVHRAVFREEGEGGRVEEVYASPVLDEQGEVVQVVEIWRDITERVEEEERLAEVERLVSLGALASGFSHEVSTPLATVLTCAESVLGRLRDLDGRPPEEKTVETIGELAGTIRQQVLRCRKITEQFRRFSRGIPPAREPIDIEKTIEGVVSLVEPTAREARVRIRISPNGSLPAVTANTEVVQHVVLNLLVNAIQSFDQEGGDVDIEFRADTSLRIRVRDGGRGISPEDRRHLFEPFRTSKPRGTGLGLFLSRTFLRRFGGDVRLLESRIGEGSCFEIEFPLTRSAMREMP